MAAARAAASPGGTSGPSRPPSSTSATPVGQSAAATGQPQARASSSTLLAPSHREDSDEQVRAGHVAAGAGLEARQLHVPAHAQPLGEIQQRARLGRRAVAQDDQAHRPPLAGAGEGADQQREVLLERQAPHAQHHRRLARREPGILQRLAGAAGDIGCVDAVGDDRDRVRLDPKARGQIVGQVRRHGDDPVHGRELHPLQRLGDHRHRPAPGDGPRGPAAHAAPRCWPGRPGGSRRRPRAPVRQGGEGVDVIGGGEQHRRAVAS